MRRLYIRPSRDIGEIALQCIKSGEVAARGFTRRMIRRVANAESEYAADLMSYILFDRSFADRLIALGFEDARAQREEILDFFDDRDLGGPVLVPEPSVEESKLERAARKGPRASPSGVSASSSPPPASPPWQAA